MGLGLNSKAHAGTLWLQVDEKLRLCDGDIECEKAYSTLAESAFAALDGFLDLKNVIISHLLCEIWLESISWLLQLLLASFK